MTSPAASVMLYFLIEETARELASRVLMCTIAAEQGMSSAIIPQWVAWKQFDSLPPGLVVFKGNNTLQTQHMLAARKAGHLVAAIEEEALGVSLDAQIQRLFDPRTVEGCDLILAQGDHVRDVVRAKDPALADRIVVTGNPRVDLLRPPLSAKILARAAEMRRVHGDYVLVNSNFGSVNPRVEDTYGDYNACLRVGLIKANNSADLADFMTWCGWERDNLELLTRVIGAYLERPGQPKIIIRPHPTENVEKWREAYRGESGVSIIREGDHLPWTAGAKLLIHTGCTTGTEAALLGTPALSLRGGTSTWHQVSTANHVNPTASSVEQAMAMIDRQLSGDQDLAFLSPDKRLELERNVLPRPDELAANQVIRALSEMAARRPRAAVQPPDRLELRETSLQVSENKILRTSFTQEAVSAMAAGFATDLGHDKPPLVRTIGADMIAFSPAA
jgi:surface carbohydrate biosynthesis protein